MGKGAFGAVYKAIHWGTGEAVAVKQIKLSNLPKSELRMIEVRSSEARAQDRRRRADWILRYRPKSTC